MTATLNYAPQYLDRERPILEESGKEKPVRAHEFRREQQGCSKLEDISSNVALSKYAYHNS